MTNIMLLKRCISPPGKLCSYVVYLRSTRVYTKQIKMNRLTFANGRLHKLRIILCDWAIRPWPSMWIFTSLYLLVKYNCLSLSISTGTPNGKAVQQCGRVHGYDSSTLFPKSNKFLFSFNRSIASSHCFTNGITSNCKPRALKEPSCGSGIYIKQFHKTY